MNLKKVHVAAELRLVRSEYISTISSLNNYVVNGQSSSGVQLYENLLNHSADIFIINEEFVKNDEIDLIDLYSKFPFSFKTILVSSNNNLLFIRSLVSNNIAAIVYFKDVELSLPKALRVCFKNEMYFSETIIKLIKSSGLNPKKFSEIKDSELVPKILSVQELQVLRLMCEDYENTAGVIGDRLGGKTDGQIKTVWKRIKLKFNLKSRKTKLAIIKFAESRNVFE